MAVKLGETKNAPVPGEAAKEVFSALEKTLKVRRLFDHGHDACREAVEQLQQRFAKYLSVFGTLAVSVTPTSFNVGKKVVLHDDRRDVSVPFRFFRDGVRVLRFREGLDAVELGGFLSVLEARPEDGHFGGDTTTMLWRQNFVYINYVAIDEIGQFDEEREDTELPEGSDAKLIALMNQGIRQVLDAIAEPGPEFDGNRLVVAARKKEALEMAQMDLTADTIADEDDPLELPDGLLERLRREVDEGGLTGLMARVIQTTFRLFLEHHCSLCVEQLRPLLRTYLLVTLKEKDLVRLVQILAALRKRAPEGERNLACELVDGLLEDLATDDAIKHLIDVASSRVWTGGLKALGTYVLRLPGSAIEPLAKHLVDLQPGDARDVLRRLLLSRASDSTLLSFLEKEPVKELIKDLKSLIALGAQDKVARLVERLLDHDDENVRLAAAQALPSLGDEARLRFLQKALVDKSAQVRLAALTSLAAEKDHKLAECLFERVNAKATTDAERATLLRAVAVLGGERAMKALEKWVGERRCPWIPRPKEKDEWRRKVILSLWDVPDSRVQEFLFEGCASKDKQLRECCEVALAMAEKHAKKRETQDQGSEHDQ